MNPEDAVGMIVGGIAAIALLIGLPWLILHYVTKWRQAPRITQEDERMLDELFHLARRLDERVQTVERLVALDHPDARIGLDHRPVDLGRDLTRRS